MLQSECTVRVLGGQQPQHPLRDQGCMVSLAIPNTCLHPEMFHPWA